MIDLSKLPRFALDKGVGRLFKETAGPYVRFVDVKRLLEQEHQQPGNKLIDDSMVVVHSK